MESPSSDTICAIATPLGEGSLGVIRVSGPDAVSIAGKLFSGKNGRPLREAPSHHLMAGKLCHPVTGKILDEVCCVVMRSPHSYTGEDVVELSGHGNPKLLSRIVEAIVCLGARLAERGEFTKRAFLNGKMDLTQAEGVMDTIRAATDQGMDCAVEELEGKLGKYLKEIRRSVLDLLSPIEACIDFPEEEVPELSRETLMRQISNTEGKVTEILKSASAGRILREGLSAVIAGKPNVGKSSLLNALLREARAIVTEIPGTTRDTVSEWADIRGVPVRLVDTAGIRSTKEEVEKLGILRSKEALAKGDLILLVLDRSVPLETDDLELLHMAKEKRSIVILNKMDLSGPLSICEIEKIYSGPLVALSVKENQGLNLLEEKIAGVVFEGERSHPDLPRVVRLRHQLCLERAREFLHQAGHTLERNLPLDLACVDLRGAAEVIGEITGECYTDDLLDKIFSEFCVGK